MIKSTSAWPILGFIIVILFASSQKASAVVCPCIACEICVQVTVPVLDAGTQVAFEALGVSIEAMNLALDAGIQSEVLAIQYYRQSVVAAAQANAMEKSQAINTSSEKENRIMEAYRDSTVRLDQKDYMIRHNLYVERNYGWDNIAYPAKVMQSSQNKNIVDSEGGLTEEIASISKMLERYNEQIPIYLNTILKTESSITEDSVDAQRVLMFLEDGGAQQSIITENEIPEALAVRRMMVAPPGVHRAQRAEDANRSTQTGYWRSISRVKAAAEFFAFDLAIRSELITDDGRTSILHLLRSWTDRIYKDHEGIKDLSHAEGRELKQWIATNQAIGNIIDLLIAEIGRYQANIEASKIGFYAEMAFDVEDGYISLEPFVEGGVKFDE